MTTQFDPDLMAPGSHDGNPGPVPPWVWLLVLALGALAGYSGYTALSKHQLYLEGETTRQELAQQRDRLQADVADLKQQLEQANRMKEDVDTALKQSRANTDAASAQIGDLQGQIGDLQQRAGSLEAAVKAAEERASQATTAKDGVDREMAGLKSQLAEVQKKLDAALADLAKERKQVSPTPVPAPAP
jgi:chromosome segregation ATPase